MKQIICIIILLSLAGILTAQNPSIVWQKTIGGNNRDVLECIIKTNDNGMLLGGISLSNISGEKNQSCRGNDDFWVVKLDEQKNMVWQTTIGGSGTDYLYSIIQTPDGGYLLGGSSYSNISGEKTENSRGLNDIWIVKLNSSGAILWQKTIGGIGGENLNSIANTADGGYILGATAYMSEISGEKTEPNYGETDYWVVKLNSTGSIVWQKTYGGTSFDDIKSVKQTVDGGYIITGDSHSPISGVKTENSVAWDYWIIKTDATGNIEWQNTIGGNHADMFPHLIICEDNTYLIAGTSSSPLSGDKTENSYGERDYWVVKLDTNGLIIWDKTLGGSEFEQVGGIIQTPDGNYIIGGMSYSSISGIKTENSRGSADFWLVKLNATGTNVLWDKTIGGNLSDSVYSLALYNNDLFIGGNSWSSISGEKTHNSRGENDYWIVQLGNVTLGTNEYANNTPFIYPNPTNDGHLNIDLSKTYNHINTKVYNVTGQLIFEKNYSNISIISDTFLNQSGMYFIQLELDFTKKINLKAIKN
ncbi:hypothetical protein FLJC2902T_06300 [Flavobacterium limnosediminis JC2902]|uniref:Secretion system C-terminal sorting domain-containing protein n=1 Tax=Flavobacterium limnosediminis JC2902 TaxID=1341181 RepID=V6SXW4_9FLAO|nr:T9SS type A sorting domain-containing protein [Flavobacterium limnosediminis]ESU29235.1 hypothetical protein FLJC2902T_06300 [Flavobacterium limnosediminis JC2902]